jgi:hypothetical protein
MLGPLNVQHTADIRIRLFEAFSSVHSCSQFIFLFQQNAYNTLNVHLVGIKIRNWSEFSVYPVLLLLAWHGYKRLLSLCPLRFSYLNFIIGLSHIEVNLSVLLITPVYNNIFSAEITNEWKCTSTPALRPRLPPVQRTLGTSYTGCKATGFWG